MRIIRLAQLQYPYYIAIHSEGRFKGQYPQGVREVPSLRRQWDSGGLGTGKRTKEFRSNSPKDLLQQIRAANITLHDDVEFYVVNAPNAPRQRLQIQQLR